MMADPAKVAWLVVEAYLENGRTTRFVVEDGLSEEEAKEMAAEHNAMLRWVGITEHWVEAARAPLVRS